MARTSSARTLIAVALVAPISAMQNAWADTSSFVPGQVPTCNAPQISQIANSIESDAQNTFQSVAAPPTLTGCLSSLNSLNISIGSLDLSSIFSNVMNQVCTVANQKISNVENGAIGQINGAIGGYTGGVGSNVVNVSGGNTAGGGVNYSVNKGGANNVVAQPVNNGLQSVLGQ